MRLILLIVLVCIVTGTFAGYITGSKVKGVQAHFDMMLEHIDVVPISDGKVALNFVCKRNLIAQYDVDADAMISKKMSIDELLSIREKSKGGYGSNFSFQDIYDKVVLFAFGGGVMKWGRPVTRALAAGENNKYVVPGIAGGLSGFYLGTRIAAMQRPPCDDVASSTMTQTVEFWRLVKSAVAQAYFLQLASIPEESELTGTPEQNTLKDVRSEIQKDSITSSTFLRMRELARYERPSMVESWLSFDKFLYLYIPFVLLSIASILLGVLLLKRYKPALRRRTGASGQR